MPLLGIAAHVYCASLLPEYERVGPLYEPLAVGLFVLVAPLVGLLSGGMTRGWVQGQRAFLVLLGGRSGGWLFVSCATLAVAVPSLLALSLGAVGYSEAMLIVSAIFYLLGAAIAFRIVKTLASLRVLILDAGRATITGVLGAPRRAVAIALAADRKLVVDVDFGPPQCLWLPAPLGRASDADLEAQLLAIVDAVKSTLAGSATGRDL